MMDEQMNWKIVPVMSWSYEEVWIYQLVVYFFNKAGKSNFLSYGISVLDIYHHSFLDLCQS